MRTRIEPWRAFCALSIFAVTVGLPAPLPLSRQAGAAFADDAGTEVIIRSLKRRKTRGLRTRPSANDQVIEELLRKRKTRGLNLGERQKLYDASSAMEQIDLPVYFGLNSAEISHKSKSTLQQLGDALTSIDLEGDRFIVGGHTDRRGSRQYNQDLSERRAEAVRDYLLKNFEIDPDALVAVGYGYEKPKNPDNPMADENRRVQLVNVGPIN